MHTVGRLILVVHQTRFWKSIEAIVDEKVRSPQIGPFTTSIKDFWNLLIFGIRLTPLSD